MFQHSSASEHPWRELDIHERHMWSEKKGSFRIARIDNLLDLVLELFRILGLLVEVLSLQQMIECRSDFSVDLETVSRVKIQS